LLIFNQKQRIYEDFRLLWERMKKWSRWLHLTAGGDVVSAEVEARPWLDRKKANLAEKKLR